MYHITLTSAESYIKVNQPIVKQDKNKESSVSIAKDSQPSKSSRDLFCSYCRTKGHQKSDCFKLKKKEQQRQPSTTTPALIPIAAVDEGDTADFKSLVASVSEKRFSRPRLIQLI